VVIQHTTVRRSKFPERGTRPPYAQSVGSGTALVLRNGKAYRARWSRSAPRSGTTFTTPAGAPMTFTPGPIWVILIKR
jgi:hypothetical protein